jgi:hypothetical protein
MTGCQGPGEVRFDRENCSIDGHQASLPQGEEREATPPTSSAIATKN